MLHSITNQGLIHCFFGSFERSPMEKWGRELIQILTVQKPVNIAVFSNIPEQFYVSEWSYILWNKKFLIS